MKLKHIIHSQAYGGNGLMDHSTSLYRGKNAHDNSFTRQKKEEKRGKKKKEKRKKDKADMLQ